MKIIESQKFNKRLQEITNYIKKDKQSAAIKFAKNLKQHIKNLSQFPYKYRKSIYFEDESIRDMTFMGYTIVYKIYKEEHTIIIIDIFNQNKPPQNI